MSVKIFLWHINFSNFQPSTIRMSTGEHKPPDKQSTLTSAKMANGQAIASSVIDPNLEARVISVQGEENSDEDGLDVLPLLPALPT
jgi:hypothetical protein